MAWALVGTIGTAVQSTAGGDASPAFGASETRAAGNLLICFVSVTKSALLPATPTGWAAIPTASANSTAAVIFYKAAAGSDAAPTLVHPDGNALIAAQLAEYSGVLATTDRTGTATATSSPVTATNGGADAALSELMTISSGDTRSVNRTPTDTITSNHITTVTQAGNNNGVNNQTHYSFAYGTTNSTASADTAIMTPSVTTSITGLAIVDAVWKLGVGTKTGSPTADSIFKKNQSATFTANAIIKATIQVAPPPTSNLISNFQGSILLNDVAYGNGYWVAVGGSGTLYYKSDTPTGAWTSNTQGSTNFQGVAYGNGYWVAVGSSGVLYYKATDPTGAWTSNTQGSGTFQGVAYGNGYWVAVGSTGLLYYKITDPTGAWTSNTQGSGNFADVTYANGYWAATGPSSGQLYYKATDPTGAWTSNAQGASAYERVQYANGYWVIAGDAGVLRYRATDPTGAFTSNTQGSTDFYALHYAQGYWVASGNAGTYRYAATDPTGAFTSSPLTAGDSLNGSAHSGVYGVFVGNGGALYVQRPLSNATADAVFKKTQSSTFTADAIVKKTGIASTFTANAILAVEPPTWVSPANGSVFTSKRPTLTMSTSTGHGTHSWFYLQLDRVSTFDSASLLEYNSNISATGWEYFNGSTWVAMPGTGMPTTATQARYTLQTDLATGPWFRRVKTGRT